MQDNTKKLIGQRINEALAKKGVMQKELAQALGVTDNTISYFVSGKRVPNTEQIISISRYFGVSTDYILGLTEISSIDLELKNICDFTGLNEKSCMTLRRIKEGTIGLRDDVCSQIVEIRAELENAKRKYEKLRKEHPAEAIELDKYIDTENYERTKEKEKMFSSISPYKDLLYASADIYSLEQDLKIWKDDLRSTEKAKQKALNCLLCHDDVDDFLVNLFIFTNTDLVHDRNIGAVIANAEDVSDSISFKFSSNLISGALMQNIQDFIRSLRTNAPQYMMVDIEQIHDDKLDASVQRLYHRDKEGVTDGNNTKEGQ